MKTPKTYATRTLFNNLRRAFVDFYRFSPLYVFGYAVSSLVNGVSTMTAAFLFGKSIDAISNAINGTEHSSAAYWLLLGSLLFGLVEQLTFQVNSIIERRAYLRYQGYLELLINQKLSGLDMQLYENEDFNSLTTRVLTSSGYKPVRFAFQFFNLASATIRIISPGVVLVFFAPWMLPMLMAGSTPTLIAEYRLSKVNWGFWQEDGDMNTLHWKLGMQLRYKEYLKEVKLYGIAGYLTEKIKDLLETITLKQDGAIKKFTKWTIASRLIETTSVIALTIWLLHGVLAVPALITLGGFTFYSSALARFSSSVGLIASTTATLLEDNLYMKDYYQLMDTKNVLLHPLSPVMLETAQPPTIEFKNVGFHYPEQKNAVLKNISFTLNPGENLALVGENGAGKTTIIKLLMRFYDPSSGTILINGKDLKEIDLESYYMHFGVLFQDFNRYPFDVRQNISIGDIHKEAKDTQIQSAIRMADMQKTVAKLPHGLSSILDPSFTKGIEPSGGQWQRVALARAFFRDANILILDEPTAAVDAKAEYQIFTNIFERYRNKSALIISHRFSTVRKADRIIVIDKGIISEEGTHESLMKNQSLYYEMFEKQAAGYK